MGRKHSRDWNEDYECEESVWDEHVETEYFAAESEGEGEGESQ